MKIYLVIFNEPKERLVLVERNLLLYVKQGEDGKWVSHLFTPKVATAKWPSYAKAIEQKRKWVEDQEWTETYAG